MLGLEALPFVRNQGKLSGRAQSTVRPISDADFNRILDRGMDDREPLLPRERALGELSGFEEGQTPYVFEQERNWVLQLIVARRPGPRLSPDRASRL
jgi:putative restriction endonuclease